MDRLLRQPGLRGPACSDRGCHAAVRDGAGCRVCAGRGPRPVNRGTGECGVADSSTASVCGDSFSLLAACDALLSLCCPAGGMVGIRPELRWQPSCPCAHHDAMLINAAQSLMLAAAAAAALSTEP